MSCWVYVPIMSGENLLVYAMNPATGQLTLQHDVHLGKGGFCVCAGLNQGVFRNCCG